MNLKLISLLSVALLLVACRSKENEATEQAGSPNGFKEGKGVYICETTRRSLQLQLVETTGPGTTESPLLIPVASILDSPEGTLVYAANEDHYIKTAVKVGKSKGGMVEILDGLLAGDSVVANPLPVRMIELNVTRAGAACCPADSKAGSQ